MYFEFRGQPMTWWFTRLITGSNWTFLSQWLMLRSWLRFEVTLRILRLDLKECPTLWTPKTHRCHRNSIAAPLSTDWHSFGALLIKIPTTEMCWRSITQNSLKNKNLERSLIPHASHFEALALSDWDRQLEWRSERSFVIHKNQMSMDLRMVWAFFLFQLFTSGCLLRDQQATTSLAFEGLCLIGDPDLEREMPVSDSFSHLVFTLLSRWGVEFHN